MLLLLLQASRRVSGRAAAQPLKDLTDTLGEYGEQAHDFFHALWPAAWGEWLLGGVSLRQVAMALAILLLTFALRWLVLLAQAAIVKGVRRSKLYLSHRRGLETLNFTISYGILLAGLFCALSVIELPRRPVDWQVGAWRFWLTLLLVYGTFIVYRVVYEVLRNVMRARSPVGGGSASGTFPLLRDLLKVAAMILVVLLVVEAWGYNATTLLAGVGIGGLAIAFAAQDTIANVFGSLIIYSDRPFKVGDWVLIGRADHGVEGDVEEIGIRSTRIRKFDKTVVLVPNKRVANEEITNFTQMTARRLKQTLYLDKGNPPEKIELALQLAREVLRGEFEPRQGEGGLLPPRLQRGATWFARLSAMTQTSYEISLYAYTISTEWQPFMELQEDILLSCLRRFEEHGIAVAQLPALALPSGKL